MRSLRRTNAIDFTELSDDDGYYSDGETSDDMINENLSQNKSGKDKNDSEDDSLSSFISIQQHLSAIDTKVSDRSQISQLLSFDDEDFYLDKLNKPFPPRTIASQIKQETIGCAIINVAHAAHYKDIVSEYYNSNKRFIAWSAIPYSPKKLPEFNINKNNKESSKTMEPTTLSTSDSTVNASDFPLVVHSFYKDAYNSYRTQIRFVHFASPSADKLDTIRNARKEIPNSRILFHYVGFGYPNPVDGCIFTCEGKNSSLTKYPIDKLMDYIKPPSIFILDCNKAGTLFSSLFKYAKEHIKDENNSTNVINSKPINPFNSMASNNQASWNDWYCLCATMNDECLPENSKLPRDFLTSCLLSPVQTSILCHIVKYYNTTGEFGKDPFEYIKKNFNKFNNGQTSELVDILHSITDSIASELVKPSTFSKIFRGDSFVSSLFYHFILAHFLLRPYNIHPISFPVIHESVADHPLWAEWMSILDTLITSTLSPLPSFSTNLFWRVSTIFMSISSQSISQSPIFPSSSSMTQAILTLMCHAIFLSTNNKGKNGDASRDANKSANQNLSLLQNSSSSSNNYYSFEASTYNLISSNKLKSKTNNFQSSFISSKSEDESELNIDVITDEQISYNAIRCLAEFASKSEKNRESLAKSITFGLLFKKLLKYFNESSNMNSNIIGNYYSRTIKKDELHALCFLIISLLQINMNLFFEVKTDSDFSRLPSLLFDRSFNQVTLSYIAAILASTVNHVSSVKILCSSRDFLMKLKESIPTFSPDLLTWCLILLKKTFDTSSIDEENFIKDSIHMQVAACIFHNDCQCRAATISSLSCFMQTKSSKKQNNSDNDNSSSSFSNAPKYNSLSKSPSLSGNYDNSLSHLNSLSTNNNNNNSNNNEYEDENQINKTLFFVPFPSFCDVSYLVRFQYLLFIIHFLSASRCLYEQMLGITPTPTPTPTQSPAPTPTPTQHSFSSLQPSKNVSQAITDLHTEIYEMMDIDTITFKNIMAEWMCLTRETMNAQTIAAASKVTEMNSSSSLPSYSTLNTSNPNLNSNFGSTNDSLFFDNGGSLNFEFGTTNFENYAKIIDSVLKREDVKIRMYAMSLFLLDYFAHDPHPSIRSTASKARHFFGIESAKTTSSSHGSESLIVKSTKPDQLPSSSASSSMMVKTKGNFFHHFNKQKQNPTPSQTDSQSMNSSPGNDVATFSSDSSSFKSSLNNQITDILSASSSINSGGFNSNSDPASNSSSSSAKSPTNTAICAATPHQVDSMTQAGNASPRQREEDVSESSCDTSQSSTFFESDSQALFNISLKKIAKSGQWFVGESDDKDKSRFYSKVRRKSSRSSNLGNVQVPGISVQLRAQSKFLSLSNNSPPTFIAHENESMNLAVATKDSHIYLFDESLTLVNQIRSGESEVSEMKFIGNMYYASRNISDQNTNPNRASQNKGTSNNFYQNQKNLSNTDICDGSSGHSSTSKESSKYICAYATCDGCMKLWDFVNSEPCLLWRASSTFNDEKTPLHFTSNEDDQMNYQSHIVTGRGSDEICVWDLMTQKLVCEYISTSLVKEYNKQVSCMTIHPTDPNVIVVGYSNGLITSLDMRAPSSTLNSSITSYSSAVSNVNLSFSLPGERIIKFCRNTNGGDILYAATSKGNAVIWNTTSGMITTSYLSRKYGISEFDVHQMLPLIVFSNKSQMPVIASTQGKVLLEMNSPLAPQNSLVAFHPIFPFVTLAAPTGELTSYNILVSH